MDSKILLYIIELILNGLVSFMAILVMSKTREAYWMMLVIGFLTNFAALIYKVMIDLEVFASPAVAIFGIPLIPLLCILIPALFFILAFVLRLCKK